MRQIFFKGILFIAFNFIIQTNLFPQGEGSIWYFGAGNGVNFNQTCDIADLSSSMNGLEGTVSISDENGKLLFYTNGGRHISDASSKGTIWNRNHEVMYDMGTTQGGGASARQSSLAIPKPNDPNNYYLFTLDENEAIAGGTYRGLSYFEIDMDQNGGLGDVVDYQESISDFPGGNEGMAAVRRPDNNSYWLVVSGASGFDYYLIDNNGISLDHPQALPSFGVSIAPFIFSPNGKYVSLGSTVGEFDTETGLFSNMTDFLLLGVNPVGSAFSPNSRYFFISQAFGNLIYRFDMQAPDIAASQTVVKELPFGTVFGNMLPAPDGNLYVLHTDINNPGQISFSGILCPNSETPCVKENVYVFPFVDGSTFGPGLPNFLAHYFISDVVQHGIDICTDQSATQICEGEEVILSVEHYLADSFEWSTGETSSSITVNTPGTYSVIVSDGCCNSSEEFFEILSETGGTLDLELTGETVICDSEPLTLNAVSELATQYLWSDNSTEANLIVTTPGVYGVTVTDDCGVTRSEEIEITESVVDELELVLEGDLNCGSQIIASVNVGNGDILWSTGETTEQILLQEAGNYNVEITSACGMSTESFTIDGGNALYKMPNAFTPDQDGTNDVFRPVWGCSDISNFQLQVFNRWGQIVYNSTDPSDGWDGMFNGSPATSDVFFYTLNFVASGIPQEAKGDVALLR